MPMVYKMENNYVLSNNKEGKHIPTLGLIHKQVLNVYDWILNTLVMDVG